ncbi:unnamed protein product [Effrenium voratum]|uniref:Uncharacterized protein n=1 Tax=Effrenium voratum TaxID=2562239 RepID=A0AA36NKT2_9DINO|nr:unnamed protein product [Effrenium voratum]CAJ1423469.1 unnamed protein product [Effrenium voratum]CAJ1443706.1 unnamed protein product [Effrenium voratum]
MLQGLDMKLQSLTVRVVCKLRQEQCGGPVSCRPSRAKSLQPQLVPDCAFSSGPQPTRPKAFRLAAFSSSTCEELFCACSVRALLGLDVTLLSLRSPQVMPGRNSLLDLPVASLQVQ